MINDAGNAVYYYYSFKCMLTPCLRQSTSMFFSGWLLSVGQNQTRLVQPAILLLITAGNGTNVVPLESYIANL